MLLKKVNALMFKELPKDVDIQEPSLDEISK
jgi:hypothetical protein